MPADREALASLHRYFITANRMRVHFDSLLLGGIQESGPFMVETWLYLSLWYSALYVVVEGWRKLECSDAVIDQLLESSNVELLRRFRNGVFHFQKKYNDHRFSELIESGTDVVGWVRELNNEFGRYLLAEVRRKPT